MRVIAIVLITSLLALSGSNAWAQESTAWRKVAEAIPLGTKVKVQTIDGKRLKGTLLRVDSTSVMVKRNTRRPEAATAITFENISNMERDHGGGMNWAKALGIGLGAGAGVIVTMFFIALQLD
jgi:hypothetical protein